MEIRLKEGRKNKKTLKANIMMVKVKSLKSQSTLVCIFSYTEEQFKNKIQVHKVHKIYHYNQIYIKVNFEAQSSLVCIQGGQQFLK